MAAGAPGAVRWGPAHIDAQTLATAWSIEDRFGLSFWDALVVASAQATGCDALLTEDLQHDMDFDGVRVVDPFEVPPTDLP